MYRQLINGTFCIGQRSKKPPCRSTLVGGSIQRLYELPNVMFTSSYAITEGDAHTKWAILMPDQVTCEPVEPTSLFTPPIPLVILPITYIMAEY